MAHVVEELVALLGLKVKREEFNVGEKSLESLGELARKFGETLLGGLAVREIYEMVEGIVEVGEGAARTAQKVGLTAESVQELGYAAKLAGVDQHQLNLGLKNLGKTLGQIGSAKGASSKIGEQLGAIGLHAADLKGLGAEAALGKISDAFASMPDGIEKTNASMALFGRAGLDMIPLLDQGSGELAKFRAEARELGIVISDEDAEKMRELGDEQKRLSGAWQSLKIQIVTALLPAFQAIVQVLQYVAQHSEIAIPILALLGVTLLALAVKAAIAWVAILGPVALVIAAIAAIAIGIGYLIKYWDDITDAVGKAWDWIVGKIKAAWARIVFYAKHPLAFMRDMWRGIKAIAGDAWRFIVDTANRALDGLVAIGHAIAAPFVAAWDFVKRTIQEAWEYAKEAYAWIVDHADSFASAIGGGAAGAAVRAALGKEQASVAGVGGAGASVTVEGSTIQQTINPSPGMDERRVGEIAAQKASELHDRKMREAADRIAGGVRP